MKRKRIIKTVCIALACVVAAAALLVGGYVGYVALQYYRIEDMLALEVSGNAEGSVMAGEEYSIMSYNLGFGAYSPEYSFFMDSGRLNGDDTLIWGKYAKGMSAADVRKNVDGQISVANEAEADFYFFQEVDEKADRSYKINMYAEMSAALSGYGSTYARNFHTAYLLYPFNDPIGKSVSGILTLSKYGVQSAVRRSFPVTTAFIDKLFDLDRCFSVHYLPVDGGEKYLVLINLHMSAYDEGGTIRALQLEMLNSVLAEERGKGNYVIAGGDFNHCLIADNFESDGAALSHFESCQPVPDWVKNSVLHESELAEGFKIAANPDEATCRAAEMPYTAGVNYSTVIDGFIVSDNVQVLNEGTLEGYTQYEFSDHNPVLMRFVLL